MNQLKVTQQQTIVALHGQGWSKRRIARELGLDRKTVRRYLAAAAPSKSPTHPQAGSDPQGSKSPGNPHPGVLPLGGAGPDSLCEPWKERIEAALTAGLSLQRIYPRHRSCNGHEEAPKAQKQTALMAFARPNLLHPAGEVESVRKTFKVNNFLCGLCLFVATQQRLLEPV